MHLLIATAGLLALLFGPQFWVRSVMARYGKDRPDYPGTGGELADHLREHLGLDGVRVEASEKGDHYDPDRKVVALQPEHYHGRSLTAVAVAAHEIGHALQDHANYRPLRMRTRLVQIAQGLQRTGTVVVMTAPLVLLASRSPTGLLVPLLAGVVSVGAAAVVHLVTLPVELDASFKRALPVLERGGYLPEADRRPARRILSAAALTYVAASLSGMLNLWYWLRLLRR
ncbi:zinc metallopeptidase [Thiohalorhabdus methylotrophus]|uniref:Zinc metallopeptidase n=1 Tax=Thiohalorhabdus methylotrophus TaxID=3242694 RepID=A0ABV4TVL1_9GAMM